MIRFLLVAFLAALLLLTVWLVSEAAEVDDGVKTVGLPPASYNEFLGLPPLPTTTTTTTARARTAPTERTVMRAASASPPVTHAGDMPPAGHYPGHVGDVPCGGSELPSCRRVWIESKGDPRIWNGGCYAPVGWAGSRSPCGGSTASGAFQFIRSTWARHGGFLNAADAPLEVQIEKAKLAYAGGAGCFHWSDC